MSNRFRNLKIGRTARVESSNNSLANNSGMLHPSLRIGNSESHNTPGKIMLCKKISYLS